MIRRFGAWLILPVTLTVMWAVCASSPPRHRAPPDAMESIGRTPNPWFFLERAYPSGRIPVHRWRAAQLQATVLRRSETSTTAIWTPRGPENIGGRITDVAVDPTTADLVYAGAAEGGIFKSSDGGQSWTAVFDQMPSLSIGALAIDPSNPNVIYAGTGEVNPGGGSMAYGGAGLFRSSDRGDSWQLVGLEGSGSIGRILVHPDDSDTLFVAVMGQLWEAGPDRGVYRTDDGGVTWERVLFVDEETGCIDLIQRPDDPDVLYAAMWQRIRQPEFYDYGGPGCAVYRSADGGDTWQLVEGGLPAPSDDGGRIGLSLCTSQPDVMHAIYADRIGYFNGLYRSTDGGSTWTRTSDDDLEDVFSSYGWWFGNVRTHPTDPDSIFVLGLDFWRSMDGGASYFNASGGMHVDHHGLDFGTGADPVIYNGNDGGVYRSDDGGDSWHHLPDLPITQAYRVALDAGNPFALYVGAQDNGTCRTVTGATDDWSEVFGGDGFQPLVDPFDSDRVWAQYQYGSLFFSDDGGTIWRGATLGIAAGDRRGWNTPHVMDPTDQQTRYFGTNRLYRSAADRNWAVISPDLTGGPHQGNPGQVDGTLTTIAVSPLDSDVIWTGSNDGRVHHTTDGGSSWNDVSAGLPDRWVTSVEPDPFDGGRAYVTISGYRWTEALPHVYRTDDLGSHWEPIAGNLPDAPVNDILADPDRPDRLFVATDVGVFETMDGGSTWSVVGAALPRVVTTSLALDRIHQILVVGTYGRSLFSAVIDPAQVFSDGFESGGTGGWSSTANSSPALTRGS